MDYATFHQDHNEDTLDAEELRASPRVTLLIRTAKLVSAQGEFVCVIRDVSATGVSLRLFHALPSCQEYSLELQSGPCFEIRRVWANEAEAGFEFAEPVSVDRIINEVGQFPKRGLRLEIHFPATAQTLTSRFDATVLNLSQQGAKIACNDRLAIDQSLQIEWPGSQSIRAKVRWRRDTQYGLVFEDTFTLREFSRLVARLQCPPLLRT